MSVDPYAVLGVAKDADVKTIRRARQKKAKELHPDRCKDADATEKMAAVNLALDILVDPVRRANYDKTGHTRVDSLEEQARKMLVQGFAQYLLLPQRVNIPKRMIQDLEAGLRKGSRKLAELAEAERAFSNRRDELETDDSMNVWAGLIDQHLDGIKADRAKVTQEMEVVKLAIAMARRYRSGVADELYPMGPQFPKVVTGRK